MSHRQITTPDRAVIQQSMTVLEKDYGAALDSTKTYLCVVLDVQMADALGNRVADQYGDRRGFLHTCTVRVIEDGSGGGSGDIPNVVITPDRRTGVLDYYEDLPRPTTSSVFGDQLDGEHHGVDPYSLDGDWCIVGFLGGHIDSPYIQRWWPHARNVFDPATSGEGSPDFAGNGQSLEQSHRHFSRVNGVETVITSSGHVYVSTALGGSTLAAGEPSNNGRFARKEIEDGGSVRVQVKSSQSLELDFNPPEDGIGMDHVQDESLPQTNPPTEHPFTVTHNGVTPLAHTYHRMDSASIYTEVPSALEVVNHGITTYTAEDSISVNMVPGLSNPLPNLAVTSVGVINLTSVGASAVTSSTALSLAAPQLSILTGTVGSPPTEPDPLVSLGMEEGTPYVDGGGTPTVALALQSLLTAGVTPVWDAHEALTNTTASAATSAIATAVATPTPANNAAALGAVGVWMTSIQTQLAAINATMKTPGVGQTTTTKAN